VVDVANDAIQPDISSFANDVYIVWKSQQSGIQLKHSNDSGTTFGPAITLANNTNISDLKLAASEDNVYIVWKDVVKGNPAIFFKKSLNNAQDFEPVVRITQEDKGGYGPELQIDSSDRIYLAWNSAENGINFSHSADGGSKFSNIQILTNNTNISDLKLAASEDNVYVVWKSDGFSFLKFSSNQTIFDNRVEFDRFIGKDINLWGSNSIDSAAIGDRLYSVWIQPVHLSSEIDSQYFDIYYSGFDTTALPQPCTR
jgi:hypothetical protein